jgi:hypothetical protein
MVFNDLRGRDGGAIHGLPNLHFIVISYRFGTTARLWNWADCVRAHK